MEILSSDSINLKIGADVFSCGNIDDSACGFEQLNASSPSLSVVDIVDQTNVQVSGTNFPTSSYDAVAIFMEVESTSFTINDSGSIDFVFDLGLPAASTASPMQIRFDH